MATAPCLLSQCLRCLDKRWERVSAPQPKTLVPCEPRTWMQARSYWGHQQPNPLEKDVSQGEYMRKRPAPFLSWSSDSFHETISEMLSAFTPKLTLFDL